MPRPRSRPPKRSGPSEPTRSAGKDKNRSPCRGSRFPARAGISVRDEARVRRGGGTIGANTRRLQRVFAPIFAEVCARSVAPVAPAAAPVTVAPTASAASAAAAATTALAVPAAFAPALPAAGRHRLVGEVGVGLLHREADAAALL